MIITSAENPKIAEVKKLTDKKYRKRTGLYVIEGERLVRDAIRYGMDITEIFVKESVQEKFDFANKTVVADKIFARISDTVCSQGILAVVKKSGDENFAPRGNRCLVLEALQDPGNVGTLLRTAAACGFGDVYAVNAVDLYSPKVLRSAMSAHFCVRLHETKTIEKVFEVLDGFEIVAADMSGQNVFEKTFEKKVALVVGNEGNGLSEFSKRRTDAVVALPMQNDVESLNAAVAGSVIMYGILQNYNKEK
ncbi:MAG: RNA methyltransferase [Corallococcus sp.]|nr:RNA methyltransferase [Corallococcus sp.]MCM1359265.1 RNA methyltransferase [Corallococcus sp.]MCM1394656.1 RNA methyltransferase [Corallococcus sp.]